VLPNIGGIAAGAWLGSHGIAGSQEIFGDIATV